jgi:predicted transcriptional regulator
MESITNETPNYYSVIPANVRYDKELRDKAKLLYGEISSLCNKDGYCWASNSYFAKLYNVSKTTISTLISELADKGYIQLEFIKKNGSDEIEKRNIYITPIKNNLNTYLKQFKYPIKKILKDNNTSNNNKNIINIYTDLCTNLPKIDKLTDKRKNAIKRFLKEFTEEDFKKICEIANKSEFLIGNNDRGWKADFDFLLRIDKANAILEGKYNFKSDNQKENKANFKQRQYDDMNKFYV